MNVLMDTFSRIMRHFQVRRNFYLCHVLIVVGLIALVAAMLAQLLQVSVASMLRGSGKSSEKSPLLAESSSSEPDYSITHSTKDSHKDSSVLDIHGNGNGNGSGHGHGHGHGDDDGHAHTLVFDDR